MSTKKLLLLDGTALVYRSFFAMQKTALTNSKGTPTGAVLGFINTMLMLIRDQNPDYVAVAFDPPGPTFRHELYPEYKVHRSPKPDDLKKQMPITRSLVEAWPCPIIESQGMEADDILGSYAAQLAGEGLEVVIVSGDKDFYQLLSPYVTLLNPGRGGSSSAGSKVIGLKDIPAKFGVDTSEAVVDVLGLMGDTSDNVRGVPGVGPKTAGKLISEFGSMEKLFANLDKVKSVRLREKLAAHEQAAKFARELVTLKIDLELPYSLEDMKVKTPGNEAWVVLLRDLEFTHLLAEYDQAAGTTGPAPEQPTWDIVSSLSGLKKIVGKIRESEVRPTFLAAIGPGHPLEASLVGLAVSVPQKTAYINVGHVGEKQVGIKDLRRVLGPLLSDPGLPKVSHDCKRLGLILGHAGISTAGFEFDTMLASYLQNPERRHTVEALVLENSGNTLPPVSSKQPMSAWTATEAAGFLGPRVEAISQLQESLTKSLEQGGLMSLFVEVELPLSQVLERMERTGITVDRGYLEAMSERLEKQLYRLEKVCWEHAGIEFNLNSPKQLAEILFERLKLPTGKKIKTGYSTDSEVLEMLRNIHPLPGLLLEYRQVAKLKSTYVDTLPQMILLDTGRVHAQFNQAVAATGRLSSSDPNLQNIPVRTELGREVRRAFIAGHKKWVLVSADYSQIELRIMADLSGDPALQHAFIEGVDVHTSTAARLLGVAPEEVTVEQRTQAKAVNFGILYGQGAYGLAKTLGIGQSEAQAFIDDYKNMYQGVMGYLEGTLEKARELGYVTTLMNRRRYLPNLNARTRPIRAAAERLAINTPIQGSAADMIKVAMVRMDEVLRNEELEARLLATVHDELLLECPQDEAAKIETLVTEVMVGALKLSVPIVVNVGVGATWAEIH